MRVRFIDKLRYIFLYLLIFLIAMYSHPTVMAMSRAAGLEKGTILSRYIILVFVLLFFLVFSFKALWRNRWLVRLWVLFGFILLLAFLFIFGKETRMVGDARAIGICMVAIFIGWQMPFTDRSLRMALLFFCGMLVYVGVMNVGGFVIDDQLLADNKNAFGVMLASTCYLFYQMWEDSRKTSVKVLMLIGMVLSMVIMLTIRARAAVLASVLVIAYAFYQLHRRREFVTYSLVLLVLLAVVIILLPDSIRDFVYNSFFQNSHGDVTSGRMARNEAGLLFFLEHPFFGALLSDADYMEIHNYPLNRLCEYGMVFCIPILWLYLYILANAVKNSIRFKPDSHSHVGFYLILIPFVISMAEPSLPFGPGTSTVFNFIIFGYSLRMTMENKPVEGVAK